MHVPSRAESSAVRVHVMASVLPAPESRRTVARPWCLGPNPLGVYSAAVPSVSSMVAPFESRYGPLATPVHPPGPIDGSANGVALAVLELWSPGGQGNNGLGALWMCHSCLLKAEVHILRATGPTFQCPPGASNWVVRGFMGHFSEMPLRRGGLHQ